MAISLKTDKLSKVYAGAKEPALAKQQTKSANPRAKNGKIFSS